MVMESDMLFIADQLAGWVYEHLWMLGIMME
jgi:hypothetical protein